jgi:xanthine dehydrogenase YagS FAD-binding subunit
LVALDASVSIAGAKGTRTIPLASFFVLPAVNVLKENVLVPGEVVTEILLAPPQAGARSTYRKVRDRGAFDFALAGAAIVLAMTDGKVRAARIVLSGVAPIPWRCAEAAVKDAAPLSKNEFKVPLTLGVLEETLLGLG